MKQIFGGLFKTLGDFFAWWFGELAALVPGFLRDRLSSGSAARLLIEIAPGGRQLYRLRGRKAHPLEPGEAQSLTKAPAVLALPRGDIVSRPTQLPLAAEENLREVVGFEMDRLTPFSRDDVYYACRLTGRDLKAKRLTVEVLLAPRLKVDTLVSGLKSEGFLVGAVDVASVEAGRPLGVNLLPEAALPAPSKIGRAVSAVLTAAALVLLFLALEIPLDRRADYAAALNEQVKTERARVAVLQRLQDEIAALRSHNTSLDGLKREGALVLPLLDQVTRLLPDDVWLNQLSLNEDRLDLAGFSPNSSALVTTFEQASRFTGTVFRAPVTQDPRLGLERFSLSLRVVEPEAGQ
ncbi:MAG: PilN domain-containing protein [Kiloniellaceae bacterium]